MHDLIKWEGPYKIAGVTSGEYDTEQNWRDRIVRNEVCPGDQIYNPYTDFGLFWVKEVREDGFYGHNIPKSTKL